MQCNFHKINLNYWYLWAWSCVTCIRLVDAAGVAIASYVGHIWCFIICFRVSFQCNVLFFVSLLSLFFLCPPNSILSRTGKKENQDASNLTVPMTMCLFPVPFPLTPSLRPQVSSINPTVTRSLLYSVLRDAPSERGLQSRDAHLSDYPSLDYQGLYVTLVTLLDLVPLLQHGQHGEHLIKTFENIRVRLWILETLAVTIIHCLKGLCVAKAFLTLKLNYVFYHLFYHFLLFYRQRDVTQVGLHWGQWAWEGRKSIKGTFLFTLTCLSGRLVEIMVWGLF